MKNHIYLCNVYAKLTHTYFRLYIMPDKMGYGRDCRLLSTNKRVGHNYNPTRRPDYPGQLIAWIFHLLNAWNGI